MSTEDRKPQVGGVYDFRGTVVNFGDDGWVWVAFGAAGAPLRISLPPSALANATLVKRAERPLAVGEVAWWNKETWTILAIDEGYAWLKACGGSYRAIALFADLRRAETP